MDCIFCKIINGEIPSKKIYESDNMLAILDLNQQTKGHTLIIPKKHIEDFTKLDEKTLKEMFDVAANLSQKLMQKLDRDGIHLGINYGSSQDIKHVHMHLCPEKKEEDIDKIYDILKDDN